MNAKLLFAILIISMFSIIISADDYPRVGGEDFDFHFDERGLWNSQLTSQDWRIAAKTLNDPLFVPLVEDIDSDSIPEIIVMDGCTIKVYSTSTTSSGVSLDIESSITIPSCTDPSSMQYSNLELNNQDADPYIEILIADWVSGAEVIHVFEHDGSSLSLQATLNCNDGINRDNSFGEIAIRCRSDGKCVAVYDAKSTTTAKKFFYAMPFAAACEPTKIETLVDGVNNQLHCFPASRAILVDDIDYDGEEEFVIGILKVNGAGAGAESYQVFELSMNSSRHITNVVSINKPLVDLVTQSVNVAKCDGTNFNEIYKPIHKHFTAPFALDVNANPSDGKEIIFASMMTKVNVANPEFRQFAMLQSGSEFDHYPSTQYAEGILLSNPFEAIGFTDIERGQGWCTMGFDDPEEMIVIHCCTGSDYTDESVDNLEYMFDTSTIAGGAYNITREYKHVHHLAHSIQTSSETNDGKDMDEILSSYGVFSLDPTGILCGSVLGAESCDAALIFANPKPDSVVIAAEVDGSNLNDLIIMQNGDGGTSLNYLDDGFQNTPGAIDYYKVDPCLDSPWQQNETAQVTISVNDVVDGDTVAARAIMYFGEDFLEETDSGELYYSFTNETESDGEGDVDHSKIFGYNGNTSYENSLLIKEIESGLITKIEFYFDELKNDPELGNLVYDFYICPTAVSSLGTKPKTQCSESATLIGDDIQISQLFGAGTGWKDFNFDEDYSVSAGTRYILYWEFVSGGLSGEHWYGNDNDGNPTSIYTVFSEHDQGTGAITNTTKSEIVEFKLDYGAGFDSSDYDSGWTSYSAPGTDFIFNFDMLYLGTNIKLRLMGRDSGRPDVEDIIDLTIPAVATTGVRFGDCSTDKSIEFADDEDDGIDEDDDQTDNPIKNAIDTSQDELGLSGLSHGTIWLFLILIIIISVWVAPVSKTDGVHTAGIRFGLIGIVSTFLLIVGVKLGFIGIGTILIIVLVAAALAALAFRRGTMG